MLQQIKSSIWVVSFSVLFAVGCAHTQPSSDKGLSPADANLAAVESASGMPFGVIDAHTHNHFRGTPERSSKIPDTLEQYLKEMKETGVVGAVVHTGENLEDYHDLKQYNVIHCAGMSAHPNYTKIEDGIKDGKFQCIKIYLGYVHLYASDPVYQKAYKLAEKYNIPVVYHTGDTYSIDGKLKYSDPLTIDEVAVDHRKVTFVIAHCGNPWIESAAEVAYKNPNVYLDGSALLVGDLSKEDPAEIEEYVVKPLRWIYGYLEDPTKLMYGTDWPLTGMKTYLEAFKRAIPPEHWKEVFHDNAVHVFHFPPKP